jgi:hypothetical protein
VPYIYTVRANGVAGNSAATPANVLVN